MSLDDFIASETGQRHLIPGQSEAYRGQCVQLIGVYTQDVYSVTLPIHPSAKDYWTYGIPGFDKVPAGQQQKGDITVYDGHSGFPDGHIAISLGGSAVFEENADPDGSPAHVFANRSSTYLLGALRFKGDNMPTLVDQNIAADLAAGILFREGAAQTDPEYLKSVIGQPVETVIASLLHSAEHRAIQDRLNAAGQVNKATVLDYVTKHLS